MRIMTVFRSRAGVTLVELLIFVALMAAASGAILGFLVLTTDARERQRARANVQQVAVQLQQALAYEIRSSHRIAWPSQYGSGQVLALQSATQAGSPVVISAISGSLVLVRGANLSFLTPDDVTVTSFSVDNTSPRDDRPSLAVHVTLQKRIPLPPEEIAEASFDMATAPLPVDVLSEGACNCALPQCVGGMLQWETCLAESCELIDTIPVPCP